MNPQHQEKLKSAGFSAKGASKIAAGKPLSNQNDRQIATIIIGSALG